MKKRISYLQKRKLQSNFKDFLKNAILEIDNITKVFITSEVEDFRFELHRSLEKKIEIYPELQITKSIDLKDNKLIVLLGSRYEFIVPSSIKINLD